MTGIKFNAFTLSGATLLLALTLASAVAQETEFNIEAQPLAKALLAFNDQSGRTVAAPHELVADKSAPAVRGEMEPEEALDRILAGTGLKSTELPGGGYTISLVSNEATEPGKFQPASNPVLMAQNQTSAPQNRTTRQKPKSLSDEEVPLEVEEIIVTGTNIQGVAPVGAKPIVFDREYIELTGLSTTSEVIQTLPQNFGGGPNQATTVSDSTANGASFNPGLGSSVNLRGLGADSTLTLVNGRRLAPAGLGSFVDLSTIPLSAVERIEIVVDGASAIYGADAVGGVVNVILKTGYEGADTLVRLGTVTDGNSDELQFAQSIGHSWDSGNVLLAYEFHRQDGLAAADRDYAANEDLRPFGGDDFRDIYGNPGTIITGGQFAIPEGQNGSNLQPSDLIASQIALHNGRQGVYLLPEQERQSVYLSLNQEVSTGVHAFLQITYIKREAERRGQATFTTLTVPDTNPFFVDPVGGNTSVRLRYSFVDDLGPLVNLIDVKKYSISSGLNFELGGDWSADVYGSYSNDRTKTNGLNRFNRLALNAALADSNPNTAFNPFGDGSNSNPNTLDAIRGFVNSEFTNELSAFNGIVNGALSELPGGAIRLAVGAEYRTEDYERNQLDFRSTIAPERDPPILANREVFAVFGELFLPFVSDQNSKPGIKELSLSVAARFDDYSDFGSSTNPRVGISWRPANSLTWRGTYGTSFRPPQLFELDDSNNFRGLLSLVDPASQSGRSNTILLTGFNSSLTPEDATTWSFGLEYKSESVENFSLGLTYFDIEYDDRIASPDRISAVLSQEELYAPIVERNPDTAVVQAFFNDPEFQDFVGVSDASEVDAILDARLNNVAVTAVSGLDIEAGYAIETRHGDVDLQLNATHYLKFEEAITSVAPLIETVDTINNPVDWRIRASISWTTNVGLRVTGFANYVDAYVDTISDPARAVNSWTTIDAQLSYDFGDSRRTGLTDGLSIALAAINLLDEDPPFLNNGITVGFDPENGDPRGRFVALQIKKLW